MKYSLNKQDVAALLVIIGGGRSSICISSISARSVKKKAVSVTEFVLVKKIAVLAISETWIGCDIDHRDI